MTDGDGKIKSDQLLFSAVGLNKQDGRIYTTLVKSGPTSIRQISKVTGINRGTTYEGIKRLEKSGLISFKVIGKRRKYFAASPERIKDLLSQKQAELAKQQIAADKLIARLAAFSQTRADEPNVHFYEDDEGIVTILKDVLSTVAKLEKREYHVYSSRSLRQYLYRRFPNFTRRRIKEKIFVRAIAIGTGGDPAELSERKFLEESATELSSSYNIIFGNKVALISVSSDLTPYGVVIEEPGVAAMQRLLFNELWKTL